MTGAGVHALVQEVDGDAGLLRAGRERLADRVEAGEGRQERRVDVDARESGEEAGREELHVTGADHELDAVLGEPLRHRRRRGSRGRQSRSSGNAAAGTEAALGAFERLHSRRVRGDRGDGQPCVE